MAEFACRRSKYFKVEAEDLDSAAEKAANTDINELDASEPEIIVREEGVIQNDVVRQTAADILDGFEELLMRYNINIYIPDDNREGEKDEAHLFGVNYYYLEDKIVEILEERLW